MSTIRCPECDAPMAEATKYCQVCGAIRSFSGLASDEQAPEIRRTATWHKEITLSPDRTAPTPLPPRPGRSKAPMWNTWRRIRYRVSPTFVLWICILVFLIGGSIFGIATSRGSGVSNHKQEPVLQVTPDSVSVGATVLLNGEHFTPYGQIGLTRDTSMPLEDTANATIIKADRNGTFTDTIVIGSDWNTGSHMITAEDAFNHKEASFSIMVTGHTTSLLPAHLHISVNTLDLGTGDEATNTTRTITLTNIGGGSIFWQGNSTQSWLTLSPTSGTFASSQSTQVIVAIDRSKLSPGSYHAQINIFSTGGNEVVPVKAAVSVLTAEHRSSLQVNPSVLSLTASDGGSSPSPQTLTVSNPGQLPLHLQITTNTGWLFASAQSTIINPYGNLSLTINVNSSLLLPGTYNGIVTLSAQEQGLAASVIQQTAFVTITILPQCTLVVAAGQLNFASVYKQEAPAAKAIGITAQQGCHGSMNWQAMSNASWLTITTTHGLVPAVPEVIINVSGLSPGTYNSSIIFSSAAGTQTIPVMLTLSRLAVPIITTTPPAISFNGIFGQRGLYTQKLTITNSGEAKTLTWTAKTIGGDWLAAYPSKGILMAHQLSSFHVTATILPALVPGTYSGAVIIRGTDSYGHLVPGSPQIIPVNLVVQPACTFTFVQGALNFTGISGQMAPIDRQVGLLVSPTCKNKLNWMVATSDSSWLAASVKGYISPTLDIRAMLAHLTVKNYAGSVTVAAQDSVTGLLIGGPQVLPVAVTVQPPCTLQPPSSIAKVFDITGGSQWYTQNFTISITGVCSGAATITSSILPAATSSWLSLMSNTTMIASGGSVTFTVTINSANLPVGQYQAIIQLTGSDNGEAIANNPQEVDVIVNVGAATEPVMEMPTPPPTPCSMSSISWMPAAATSGPIVCATPISTPIPTASPAPILTPTPTPVPLLTPIATPTPPT